MATHFGAAGLDASAGPYAEFFDYGSAAGGNTAVLIEGLLRLETCSALIESGIAAVWRDLALAGKTIAQDINKQRADCLFGLDGQAGLLGQLKAYRRMAANTLPDMTGAAQAEFLAELVSFSGAFLPGRAQVDLWAWCPVAAPQVPSAALALPVYLQALAMIVLVRGWIGGLPGADEQAAMVQHRSFLTGPGVSGAEWSIAARLLAGQQGGAAAAVAAAARALAA